MRASGDRRGLRPAVAGLAVVICLAGAGAWLAGRGSRPATPASPPAAAPAPAAAEAPPPLAAAPHATAPHTAATDDAAAGGLDAPAVGNAGAADEGTFPLSPSDGPVLVRITYVGGGEPPAVLEIQATPDDQEEATVSLLLRNGIREGRLPAAKVYRLSFLFDGIGGLRSTVVSVPPELALAVEVTPPERPTLRVLDAATNLAVPGAQVFPADGLDSGTSAPAPGDGEERSAAHPTGGVVLPKLLAPTDVWVGAEGYAWVRVSVAPGDRDRPIGLVPGGGLRVLVDGVTDWSSLKVLATPTREPTARPDGEGYVDPGEVELRAADAPGRYEQTGLRPGPWRVRIGWSVSKFHVQTLQSVDTTVRERQVTEVGVRVSPPVTGPVALEIGVPAAWGSPPGLEVSGIGGAAQGASFRRVPLLEGPAGTWVARIPKLPPGLYQVSIDAFGFSRLLRLGAGATTARIEVPPPILLRVRVVDDRSGASLADAAVTCGSATPFDRAPDVPGTDVPGTDTPDPVELTPADFQGGFHWTDGGSGPAARDPATGEYVRRVPSGRAFVEVGVPGYLDARITVSPAASAPETRAEVRVTRGGTLLVRVVREGRISASTSGTYELDAISVDGWDPESQGIRSGDYSGGSMRLDGLAPGKYRVHLGIHGVEPQLVQEVDVRAGEEKTADFELPAK